jgi:hypothetical protein
LQLLCSCKVAVRPVFDPKPINILIYQSYNCTNTKNRVEANYTYIKQYLGSKKTYSNFFNIVAGIEEAVNNQISNIIIGTARQQDYILLDIDRKVFRGMFGVVTWYILRKVQSYYNKTQKLLKPCTGQFIYTIGLLYTYIYNKRTTGEFATGLQLSDFYRYWFWDPEDLGVLLLEPLYIQYCCANIYIPTS